MPTTRKGDPVIPKILDLYCGMGGLSLGFLAGLEDSEALGLDIDRYAVMTYNHNLEWFNARAEVQDILEWEPRGEYDIIIGGVPCQPYSLANTRRRGKNHPLYPTLPRFFDIVLELRPKVFLMENVKGLITRRHKPLLLEQLRRVEQDYRIAYKVLNAAYYGVPQRRERLFVLGVRRDLGITPELPEPTHAEQETITLNGKLHRWITVREAIGDLLAIPPISYPKKLVQTNPRHGKPISLDEPSRTVKVDGRGGDFTFDTMLVPVTEHALLNNKTYDYDWSKRSIPLDKPSYTITEHHRDGQMVEIPSSEVKYRRLTVRECLRLQSFPDWWGFPEGISISRKYKLVGEAVPPILAYRIAVKIGELLGWNTKKPSQRVFLLPYYSRAFPPNQ